MVKRHTLLEEINNGCGIEFRNYNHPANQWSGQANDYMAAKGHFGDRSPQLVRHLAEDLGFDYIAATNKDEYLAALPRLADPAIGTRPMLIELFTTIDDEQSALHDYRHAITSIKDMAIKKVAAAVKKAAGPEVVEAVKRMIR